MKTRTDASETTARTAAFDAGQDRARDAGGKGHEAEPAPLPERLVAELTRMTDLLRALPVRERRNGSDTAAGHGGTWTAILRLEPDLDMDAWRSLADSTLGEGWIALPLPADLVRELENTRASGSVPSASGREAPSASDADGHPNEGELSGLLPAPLFMERLGEEARRAGNEHAALCLALFEVRPDSQAPRTGKNQGQTAQAAMPDQDAPAGKGRALSILGQCLRKAAHVGDIAGYLAPDMLALIMPGVGPFQALALAERVVSETDHALKAPRPGERPALPEEEAFPCLVRAGVAELSRQDTEREAPAIVDLARLALRQASPATDAPVHERVRLHRPHASAPESETLVLASEKQFLFFGRA